MAHGICYTQSRNVKKYESSLWERPWSGSWSSAGIVGTITTPDSDGNYTVTCASEYEDTTTQTSYYCTTNYGGIEKKFYFTPKENIPVISEYNINCGASKIKNKMYLSYSCQGEAPAGQPFYLDYVFNSGSRYGITINRNSAGSVEKDILNTQDDTGTLKEVTSSPSTITINGKTVPVTITIHR